MTTAEAIGRRHPIGSPTAPRQIAKEALDAKGGSNIVTGVDVVTEVPKMLVGQSGFLKWLDRVSVGKYADKIAEVVTSPDALEKFSEINKISPRGEAAWRVFSQFVTGAPDIVPEAEAAETFPQTGGMTFQDADGATQTMNADAPPAAPTRWQDTPEADEVRQQLQQKKITPQQGYQALAEIKGGFLDAQEPMDLRKTPEFAKISAALQAGQLSPEAAKNMLQDVDRKYNAQATV